ncbi:MAG TPA: lamin tail domain-containing protein [Gaiellaceae bacterium]|nr:lamin tail domain-containing protein [Gaiellaceae bacterium]
MKLFSRAALCVVLLSLLGVVSVTAANAAVPAVDTDIHISEVFADGGASSGTDAGFPHDFIELTNTGAQDETLTGWSLKDDTDSHNYPIDDGTVIPAGGYVAFNVDDSTHAGSFGIGKGGDAARVYDGSTLVDQFWFTAAAGDGNDFDRCSIGGSASAVVVSTGITPGAANDCPTPAAALATVKGQLKVNEVLASGTGSGASQQLDAIELYNTGTTSVNLAGWWLSDDKATDKDVLPAAGSVIAPAAAISSGASHPTNYLTYRVGASSTSSFLSQDIFLDSTGANLPGNKDFGIGAGGDNAALVAPDGTDADRLSFGSDPGAVVAAPANAGDTMSRCPDGASTWAVGSATLGATNVCGPAGNPADTSVKINEVDRTNGIVELKNTSTTASADVNGFKLSDNAAQALTIASTNTAVGGSAGTAIPAGGYAEVSLGTALTPSAASDTVTLADGTTTVDTSAWTAAFTPSWGRCPDGSGAFSQTAAITDGAAGTTAGANACSSGSTTGYNAIRVSEIETNGDPLGDWIELTNTGNTAINISGLYLADNGGTQGDPTIFPTDSGHFWQIPGTNQIPTDTTTAGNTVLPAHGYHVFFESNTFPFGLGNPDQARIFSPTKALIDATSWPLHESGATYVRCPGVTQGVDFTDTADNASFIDSSISTPNAANDCTPPIRINEVQASDPSGAPDWVELTNVGSQPVNLSGWVIADDKDSDGDVIPNGITLNPGAFVTFEPNNENGQFSLTSPASKPFGLGASGDEVRVYEAGAWNGTAYVAADLVDAFVFEDASTKSGGAVLPQTLLADGVTKAGGPWPVNVAQPASPETYARCADGISQVVADGTGAWSVTSTPTEGATNQCNGLFTAIPWPDTHNGQAVTTADNVDLGQNVSGLYYVGGNPTTTADDYIWAIQNGSSGLAGENSGDPGSLYKLVQDSSGKWGPAPGWEFGVPVRYLNDTTGEPDSEGVTAVNGKVYVASERDNTNDTVSKISVLEVNPNNIVAQNGDKDGDLNATHEWDLGPDLGPNPGTNPETGLDPNNPGDANLGIEAVAFVPDSYLTSAGFKDEHTGATYNPANYPSHIDGGVFFVGLEKTGKLYGYVFNSDNTFTRIATVSTGFQTIQDLLWDPSQDVLRATCDNGCQGRSSILAIDTNPDAHQGTFQVETVYSRPTGATQNLNNEGFTLAPISECVNGSRAAYWSDDSDDGGHWLRTASVDCTADTTPPTVTASAVPAANANGWNNSSVTVSFNCTDAGSGVDTADSTLASQVLTASGTATGTCIDNAGNTASASYTAQIDTVAPTVTLAGNKGSYGILDTVAISCTAADALSGVASPTCTGANGAAWTFGAGAHTLNAQAADKAGNIGSASTTFTVTVKPTDLAKLTTQFVTGSAKYESANPINKIAVSLLVTIGTNAVLDLTPSVKPAAKAQLLALYKTELNVLVSSGYLTSAQETTLLGLSAAL